MKKRIEIRDISQDAPLIADVLRSIDHPITNAAAKLIMAQHDKITELMKEIAELKTTQ